MSQNESTLFVPTAYRKLFHLTIVNLDFGVNRVPWTRAESDESTCEIDGGGAGDEWAHNFLANRAMLLNTIVTTPSRTVLRGGLGV
jgi:hypothetical protein